MRDCRWVSRLNSSGVNLQRASGLRRQVPVPEQGASTSTGPPGGSTVSAGAAENLYDNLSRPRKRGRPAAEGSGYFFIDKTNRKMTCRACMTRMFWQAGRYNSHLLACSKFKIQHRDVYQRLTSA